MHRKNFSYLRLWIFLFFLLLIPSGQNIFASIASATKPLLAQKPASGAEEQIQQVFVWDETTKTLYSCRVQRQIFQNCTLGIPFDPSGYFTEIDDAKGEVEPPHFYTQCFNIVVI